MTKEQAQSFATQHIIPSNNIACCVDGRYHNDGLGAVAKPGADAGDIMVAFAAFNRLGCKPEPAKVVKAVVESVGVMENFHFHTDNHADPYVPGLGCGHLRKAQEEPAAYGLAQEQMNFLFASLPELLKKGARQEVLRGSHEEQAVIVVASRDYSLQHQGLTEGINQQVFVYQETLAERSRQRLVQFLAPLCKVAPAQLLTAMNDAATMQLGATLQRLAAHLPVYRVTITDGQIAVS